MTQSAKPYGLACGAVAGLVIGSLLPIQVGGQWSDGPFLLITGGFVLIFALFGFAFDCARLEQRRGPSPNPHLGDGLFDGFDLFGVEHANLDADIDIHGDGN
jgi:hypothetical protein